MEELGTWYASLEGIYMKEGESSFAGIGVTMQGLLLPLDENKKEWGFSPLDWEGTELAYKLRYIDNSTIEVTAVREESMCKEVGFPGFSGTYKLWVYEYDDMLY